jgi:hypothetical protein
LIHSELYNFYVFAYAILKAAAMTGLGPATVIVVLGEKFWHRQ